MTLLKDELQAYGCNIDRDSFREMLADTFARMFPGQTDEDMLCDEFAPRRFVRAIRSQTKAPDLPYNLILRSLLNVRKNPH